MGLFRLILIAVLIYLVIKFVDRFLFPPVSNTAQGPKEGDVTVDGKKQSNSSRINKKEGDYVEYEEIE